MTMRFAKVQSAAESAMQLAHLLGVLRNAAKHMNDWGFDVDARIIEAHCAQLQRGYEWPGDREFTSPSTVDET